MTRRSSWTAAFLAVALLCGSCSIRKYAINQVGDSLASGQSVWETDEDPALVQEALPFSLKLLESLIAESPDHRGLRLTACRGFVLYSYGYVDFESERAEDEDLDRSRALRTRARKLYLRALDNCLHGLDQSYPGWSSRLTAAPEATVKAIENKKKKWDLPFLYWTAAALGLAISVSGNDAAMLARIPEVEALVNRALDLDEAWNEGALHEFQIVFLAAKPGRRDVDRIRHHYERALALSAGKLAGPHLAYADAVAVPTQNRQQFLELLDKALAIDADAVPGKRLVNLLAQRRARWLRDRVDELFLTVDAPADETDSQP